MSARHMVNRERMGANRIDPATDPRLAQAVEMRRANPKRAMASIARELGMGTERAWEAIYEAGLEKRPDRAGGDDAGLSAPAWYNRPCGRVQALRRAHGIVVP